MAEGDRGAWVGWSQPACFAAPADEVGAAVAAAPGGLGGAPACLRVFHLSPSYSLSEVVSKGQQGSPGATAHQGPLLPAERAWPVCLGQPV